MPFQRDLKASVRRDFNFHSFRMASNNLCSHNDPLKKILVVNNQTHLKKSLLEPRRTQRKLKEETSRSWRLCDEIRVLSVEPNQSAAIIKQKNNIQGVTFFMFLLTLHNVTTIKETRFLGESGFLLSDICQERSATHSATLQSVANAKRGTPDRSQRKFPLLPTN